MVFDGVVGNSIKIERKDNFIYLGDISWLVKYLKTSWITSESKKCYKKIKDVLTEKIDICAPKGKNLLSQYPS